MPNAKQRKTSARQDKGKVQRRQLNTGRGLAGTSNRTTREEDERNSKRKLQPHTRGASLPAAGQGWRVKKAKWMNKKTRAACKARDMYTQREGAVRAAARERGKWKGNVQ